VKKLRPRLTFANVVSCLALFVALGGSAYAATQLKKNSVGAKQLKKNAVTTAKIENEAVTGAKVQLGSLGTVPSAAHADSADSATSSTKADFATNATTAANLAPPEAVHIVGTAGEPPFESGFKDIKNVTPLGFYKDRQCVVHFVGTAEGPSGQNMFTLPSADRPAEETLGGIGVGTTLAGTFELFATGQVAPFAAGAGDHAFFLEGASFRSATC
jgi:hypothetical protein